MKVLESTFMLNEMKIWWKYEMKNITMEWRNEKIKTQLFSGLSTFHSVCLRAYPKSPAALNVIHAYAIGR